MTETEIVEVGDNAALSRYEIHVGGKLAGFTTYELHGSQVALMHTEVEESFAHRGLASRLIRVTLDDLSRKGKSVLPFCPYVRSFIAGHPDYLGLVPERHRAIFGLVPEPTG